MIESNGKDTLVYLYQLDIQVGSVTGFVIVARRCCDTME
jgi:hypothetical protein